MLCRSRCLQLSSTKYSFEKKSKRDLQDLHASFGRKEPKLKMRLLSTLTLMRLWVKRTEIENEVMKIYTD